MTSDPQTCTQPAQVLAGATEPSFSAAPYSVPAPENTAAPRISGSPKVGHTLTAGTGSWTMRPTSYSYQWLRAGHPVSGATRSTYRLVRADGGKGVSVTVTAHGAGGSTHATSPTVNVTP